MLVALGRRVLAGARVDALLAAALLKRVLSRLNEPLPPRMLNDADESPLDCRVRGEATGGVNQRLTREPLELHLLEREAMSSSRLQQSTEQARHEAKVDG